MFCVYIDIEKLNPKIILYESMLIDKKDKDNATEQLKKQNYNLYSDGIDSLAYK
jgi:hypothetical protein